MSTATITVPAGFYETEIGDGFWSGPVFEGEKWNITSHWTPEQGVTFYIEGDGDNAIPASEALKIAAALQAIGAVTAAASPAGFAPALETSQVDVGGDLHKGPAAGRVETSWSPEEGTLVYVGDSEGMSTDAARELASDLLSVLGTLSAAS